MCTTFIFFDGPGDFDTAQPFQADVQQNDVRRVSCSSSTKTIDAHLLVIS
jgi:hypothetical protein